MKVSGHSLLNSAESIVRDRSRNLPSAESNQAAGRPTAESNTGSAAEARLLQLQASLGRTQNDFSREQMRFAYLNGPEDQITIDLTFGGEALFPELNQSPLDIATLRQSVQERMTDLTRQLRGTEVEMENLFALRFDAPPATGSIRAEQLLDPAMLRGVDPDRVAQLTRQS